MTNPVSDALRRCPSCQNEPPPSSSFCNLCGAPLADKPASGERRWLSVMFCDMVGSTELAQYLDIEELQQVIGAYQNAVARVVRAFDGHIAQYLGDGLLVYFGYPQAHEDDALRCVRAGLGVLAALPGLNADLKQRLPRLSARPIEVRVGIHSGRVVLSDMGRGEDAQRLALGDTLNISARLQSVASSGQVLISDATLRLVRGAFATEDLGDVQLKGVEEPVRAHRVVAQSGAETRLERLATVGLTPLVGREQEIALALDRWTQSREGRGQVVLLSGDAGIGKSRLVAVLEDHVAGTPHTWLCCRCTVHHENSAFYPVAQMLEQVLGIEDGDSEAVRRSKIAAGLRDAGLPPRHLRPLVGLLSAPGVAGEREPPSEDDDPREALLDSLCACLFQLASERPLVLVVEDLHWIDPSTLELLGRLVARSADKSVLLVFTFRPDFEIPWKDGGARVHIGLHPLTRDQISALCTSVAGGRALPTEVLGELVTRADGVPLFAEELTRTVLESDLLSERDGQWVLARSRRNLAIPSTLQESLMARLDGVGASKQLAQLCAVFGREISGELLRAVAGRPESALQAELARLVAAGLLDVETSGGQERYVFRHSLIRDTAYDSLLRSERQALHSRIARVLRDEFPERSSARPDELARHHELAGSVQEALRGYQRAANQAVDGLAHAEAVGHLTTAIGLLGLLPAGAERDASELDLQVALGTSSMIALGQGHPQVETAHRRARELAEATGDQTGLFRALWGLSRYYQSQGRPAVSQELSEQLLELARCAGDPSQLRWAHLGLGQALFWRGDPEHALPQLFESVRISSELPVPANLRMFGQDPELSARALIGPSLCIVGEPDRGLAESVLACEIAQKQADPFTQALVLCFAAVTHQLRGERVRTRERAEAGLEIARRRDIPLYGGLARVMMGWARATGERDAAGIDEIQRGLADLQGTGTGLGGPYVVAMLAEALRAVGNRREALAAADTALALADQQQSPFWNAELLRLKGELLRELDPQADDAAEPWLRRSLDAARARNARSFELRAALSLHRLLAGRGAGNEGLTLIRHARDGFVDGRDTDDLRRAAALLGDAT